MDTKGIAKAARLQQEQLDAQFPSGFLHICTIDNRDRGVKGGRVSEVSTLVASGLIVEHTGRIATSDEVAALAKRHAAIKEVLQRTQRALDPKPLSVSVR